MTVVTDQLHLSTASPHLDAAYAAAGTAARAADVEIRCLESIGELEAVRRLYERIWRTGETSPIVTADLLRALAKAGSYVSGAFIGDELVGSCFGFFSPPARAALHSHIAGVLPQARRRQVGFALKLHQRAWTLAHGIGEICWTYDPLVRRNAYFNIAKLAADPAEYLPDFYGPIDDGINRSDHSDRILVRWDLESPDAMAAAAGRPRHTDTRDAAVALGVSKGGAPARSRDEERAGTVLVAVPEDIEALRGTDPACAASWRAAVREVLGELLADGGRVSGFDPAGWYLVDREGPAGSTHSPGGGSHPYAARSDDMSQETA
ncbi:GNAT family N-acetyltransferase [Streptomyces sp. NPDC057575]|uniref:GNAT family N-acetyltransferase n=1 Tax=unclassified Streptomyces TaxID=2593676 RepID=UPI00369A0D39